MARVLKTLAAREDGQSLAEYALVLVYFALTAVAATATFGSSLANLYSRASQGLATPTQHAQASSSLQGSSPSVRTDFRKNKKTDEFKGKSPAAQRKQR